MADLAVKESQDVGGRQNFATFYYTLVTNGRCFTIQIRLFCLPTRAAFQIESLSAKLMVKSDSLCSTPCRKAII